MKKDKKMEDFIHEVGNKEIAQRFVRIRKEWEKEQIKHGKKEVLIPHPGVNNTFIDRKSVV